VFAAKGARATALSGGALVGIGFSFKVRRDPLGEHL
jgi:hypothetical protein